VSDRVVAFDIHGGRNPAPGAPLRVALTGARPAGAPEPPAPAPKPAAAPPSPPASPAPAAPAALVSLAAAYAGALGVELAEEDLAEALAAAGAAEAGLPALAAVLSAAGFRAGMVAGVQPAAGPWPALALMWSGSIALVLGAGGGNVTLYDPAAPDGRSELAAELFAQRFTGQALVARRPLAAVVAAHAEPGRAPHWFWGALFRHRRAMAEVAAGSLVANLLSVAIALFSLQVYDRVIPNRSEPTLWVLALGALVAIGLEGALKVARATLMDNAGRRVDLAVQALLMERLLGARPAAGPRRPSQVFAALREFAGVREFFSAATIGTLADLPFVVMFLILIALIGGPVVWVLLLAGILMIAPGFLFRSRMVALTAATQGAATRAARVLQEAVIEADTIAAGRAEGRMQRLWDELSAVTAQAATDQRRLTSWLSAWAAGVQQAAYVVAVVVGTYLAFAGQNTVGAIIAVGLLSGRALGPLSQTAALLVRWTQVRAALDGLEAIAAAPQREEPGRAYLRRPRLTGAVELSALQFRHAPEAPPSVDVPALAIPAGQHVAVLGANGSGKSTLLRLLSGLAEPSSGRILLDGVDMGQIHPRDLRRGIGWLPQEVRLLSGTLRDNLNLHGLLRDDDRMLSALDFAGLGPFVRGHPRGLDLPIHELGEGLSVGQRQSLGWARLWLQDPAVAILDEPTAALDQTLEATLVARLGPWLAGRTAVIATHRVPILNLTGRVLILQGGRVAVDGPRDAVLAHLMRAQGAGG
jgi:ATP-binding cassette subfamily C protein LapB